MIMLLQYRCQCLNSQPNQIWSQHRRQPALVDNPKFRKCFSDFDARFAMPCRQTFSYSMLPSKSDERKKKLIAYLEGKSHVALTTDAWSDRRSHTFLAVTVHTVDNGIPQSRLLAFRSFPGSHTGSRIADELQSIIDDVGLEGKVRFIVSDNSSNMKKALSIMFYDMAFTDSSEQPAAEYLDDPTLWEDLEGLSDSGFSFNARRLPCFAHSLQLVVRDALSCLSFARPALGKVSKLSNLVHQSPLFWSEFEAIFGSSRSIPETNATRWNSVWQQLHAVVQLEPQKLQELLKTTAHENLQLTSRGQQQLQEIVDILAPFAELTDICQGEKTATVSCVVPGLVSLEQMLKQKELSTRHSGSLIRKLHAGISCYSLF